MAPRTPKDPAKVPTAPKAVKTKATAAPKSAPKSAPKGTPKADPKPAAESPATRPAKPAKAAKPADGKPKAATLRLRDLVAEVATATGAKKPAAKKSIEAVLAAMSAALASGSDLALPPLGKLRVARTAGNVLTLKLRTGSGEKPAGMPAGKPLADDGEDD